MHRVFFKIKSFQIAVIFLGLVFPLLAEKRVNTSNIESSLKGQSIPEEWKSYLNPKDPKFWTEGNHVPDAGFLLFATNPSKETAKLWVLRMEMKAKKTKELYTYVMEANTELMEKGLVENRYGLSKPSSKDKNLTSQVLIYFLFSKDCQPSRRLAQVLKGFENVVPLQAHDGPLYHFEGLEKSQRATKETLSAYSQDGTVPLLILYDAKNKSYTRMQGFQTREKILEAISFLFRKGGS